MKKETTTKEAYASIFKLLNKHKDILNFDIGSLKDTADKHLFGLELRYIYGLNIEPKEVRSTRFNTFFEYIRIYRIGTAYNNRISWSDDGRQPEGELLVEIGFPTGPYIFGGDYPTDLFEKFFKELKTYKPKYSDTTNKSLYFAMDNAKEVFNNFKDILNKYNELNKEDYKLRRIKKMEDDLQKLKSK